jgi:hypothetical protein
MVGSNNVLLVLTILMLLVSIFGTLTLLNNITFVTPPVKPPSAIQRGEIGFTVLPEPGSDSAIGYIGLTVLPEE